MNNYMSMKYLKNTLLIASTCLAILAFIYTLSGKSSKNIMIQGNGTEPFWAFEFQNDTLLLKQPSDSGPMHETMFSNIQFSRSGDNIELSSEELSVSLEKETCSDGMSDLTYEYRSTLRSNSLNYNGCANIVETL